jgi:hypothetical protein
MDSETAIVRMAKDLAFFPVPSIMRPHDEQWIAKDSGSFYHSPEVEG